MTSYFNELARDLEDLYGNYYSANNYDCEIGDKNEDECKDEAYYFICPFCDEPIYSCDWSDEDLAEGCPVCEEGWFEDHEFYQSK